MARPKKKKVSTRGLFVQILTENPHLLELRNNEEVLDRFKQLAGGKVKITQRHRQYVANIKSDLKKRGVPTANGASAAPAKARSVSTAKLDHLEELIDGCLINAREIDQNGSLKEAVQYLRAARNFIVRHALGG